MSKWIKPLHPLLVMVLLTATESKLKQWDLIQVQHAVNPCYRKTLDGMQISWALEYSFKVELLATLCFGTAGVSHVFLTRNCNEQRYSSFERKRNDMLVYSRPHGNEAPSISKYPHPTVWCLKSPSPLQSTVYWNGIGHPCEQFSCVYLYLTS